MAKKQSKPIGLIIATSVLAVLFTLSAVVIGLFVGSNSDTVLAAIKNKETSFVLASDVENVTAQKDEEIANITAEKDAELEAAQLEKEQAIADAQKTAEEEKKQAAEDAKKQALLDRHVIGISNINEIVGVELNSDTWSAVNEIIDFEPIEAHKSSYYNLKFELNKDNVDAFCTYLTNLNLDGENQEEYVILSTSDYKIFAKAYGEITAICFGDINGCPFGVNTTTGEFLGGTFSDNFNRLSIYGDWDKSFEEGGVFGFNILLYNRNINFVAENQCALDGWGTFLIGQYSEFYSEESTTPAEYYYTQPLEFPGIDVAFDDVERFQELEEDFGLETIATICINGEEMQFKGVAGLISDYGTYAIYLADNDMFSEDNNCRILIYSGAFILDFGNEIGFYPGDGIDGGASLLIESKTAIESFVIESITVGDTVLEMGS